MVDLDLVKNHDICCLKDELHETCRATASFQSLLNAYSTDQTAQRQYQFHKIHFTSVLSCKRKAILIRVSILHVRHHIIEPGPSGGYRPCSPKWGISATMIS